MLVSATPSEQFQVELGHSVSCLRDSIEYSKEGVLTRFELLTAVLWI